MVIYSGMAARSARRCICTAWNITAALPAQTIKPLLYPRSETRMCFSQEFCLERICYEEHINIINTALEKTYGRFRFSSVPWTARYGVRGGDSGQPCADVFISYADRTVSTLRIRFPAGGERWVRFHWWLRNTPARRLLLPRGSARGSHPRSRRRPAGPAPAVHWSLPSMPSSFFRFPPFLIPSSSLAVGACISQWDALLF